MTPEMLTELFREIDAYLAFYAEARRPIMLRRRGTTPDPEPARSLAELRTRGWTS